LIGCGQKCPLRCTCTCQLQPHLKAQTCHTFHWSRSKQGPHICTQRMARACVLARHISLYAWKTNYHALDQTCQMCEDTHIRKFISLLAYTLGGIRSSSPAFAKYETCNDLVNPQYLGSHGSASSGWPCVPVGLQPYAAASYCVRPCVPWSTHECFGSARLRHLLR